ncbi:uncharacterized protein LOC132169096 [Corylus avellana]|uniref:uncharacterized protein LOC132169096 n=1 Tax=Corylus avellana TaxID=13451 RepID=UPI00286D3E45|nr:uncharacterized protein LOC132169096 [Corylus avellana]
MGIKLKPKEIQLLLEKLYKKASGESESDIPECNLYGEKEPWQIWEEAILASACMQGGGATAAAMLMNQKEVCVFTKVKKKTLNSSRIDQTVGIGMWKMEDTGVTIYGNATTNEGTTTELVGIRKRFRYESKMVHHDRWIMYKYALQPSMLTHAKFQNYVLCQIKKMEGSEKKRKPEEEEDRLDQILTLNHIGHHDDEKEENMRLTNIGHDDGSHIFIDLSNSDDQIVDNIIETSASVPMDEKQSNNSPESNFDNHTN